MKRTNGELKLLFRKKRNGQTYLSKQFYVLPLQITVPYYQDNDGTAFLNPLNMGGGVMGEDHLRTEIELEENSQVLFTNLSATKIFKLQQGRPNVLDAITNNEVSIVINTPDDKKGAMDDSYIRKGVIKARIPYVTTMAAAKASLAGIKARKKSEGSVKSLQQYHSEIE